MRRLQRWLLPIALGLAGLILLTQYLASGSQPGDWSYSELVAKAQAGEVASVTISGASGLAVDTSGHKYNVALPSDQSVTLADNLKADGVKTVAFDSGTDLGTLLITFLPNLLILLLVGGLIYWSYRSIQRGQGQAMSFGRSKPRLMSPERSLVTFADVAGVEEAQEELKEIVEFLKTPEKFRALGARIPRGVLMVGPPGSGKTLLARAVAGEAGVPFFSISGSEFVEMFVGVGASRVRDLFDQAKKSSPCIVFVDEIDAVGRQRGAGLGGGNDEREQTLNQLLVEMDGFDTDTHVIVIAATNRPDVLDPALLRPGRFDRHVVLDRPDVRGRRAILDVHVKDKPLAPEVDLNVLARQTPGFCGADLANLVNEGAILAARSGHKAITMDDLEEAIYRVIAGPERKSVRISDEEKQIVAYHEAGHALVMHALPHTDRVHRISIMSRGSALGWTLSLPGDDQHLANEVALHEQLAGLMGGRVAEEIVFGNVTSGAENDIKKATQLSRRMVTQWGMSQKVGPVSMGENNELVFLGRDLGERRNYSEQMASLIDDEVRRFVEDAREVARTILTERRAVLGHLADRLISEETVEGEELDRMLPPAQPQIAIASSP
ncbi:MAG TPA: ATP-dependent zinc metalloprotease FtsH [Clostridia bacterium]|nr:ATP-dependent zinc metalloprotease FtsH [Clostridia bacterium]